MNKEIEILENDGVILTPTDTTFGLSALAFNQEAVNKVNEIKQRPIEKKFILLVDNAARLQRYVEVPDLAWDIMDLSEKPVTIVYDTILDLPPHLLSEDGTVAIRMIQIPFLQKIIQKVKQPLVSTSANLTGESAPQNFSDINPAITQNVDYIMPECKDFKPFYISSSIIALKSDYEVKVIRE